MRKGWLWAVLGALVVGTAVVACVEFGGGSAMRRPQGAEQAFVAGGSRGNAPLMRIATLPSKPGESVPLPLTAAMARRALGAGTLAVELPGGARYAIGDLRRRDEPGGRWTLVGRVQTAVGPQSAVLTFGDDAVFGVLPKPDGFALAVTTTRGVVRVGPAGGMVPEGKGDLGISPDFALPGVAPHDSRVPLADSRPAQASAGRGKRPPAAHAAAEAAAGDDVRIDILGLYTDELVALRGSVGAAETEVTSLVAIANQAHLDSGTRVRLSLAGMREIQANPDRHYNSQLLDDITYNQLEGTDIPGLRDQYGADLVFVVRPHPQDDGSCGIAWLQGADQGRLDVADQWGFSVTDVDPCGPYVLAHELGHNLGSAHDRETSTSNGVVQYGAYVYSFGYRQDGPPAFATIMAYQQGRPWLGYFSSPGSTACGAACGVAGKSDNVRSFNAMAPAIAAFRGKPGTLSIADAEGIEGVAGELSWIRVPIRLTGFAPAGGVSFRVEVTGGTATPAIDYEPADTDTLTIPAGAREADFMLGVIGDDLAEGDETVALRLSDVTNAGVDDTEAIINIADDDPRPRIDGQMVFPQGMTPPDAPVTLYVYGADGHPGDIRYVELQPPDFRYSVSVPSGTPGRLWAPFLPSPFAAKDLLAGEITSDVHIDYPVMKQALVSGHVRLPEGGPALTGNVQTTLTQAWDGRGVMGNYNWSLGQGEEYSAGLVPGAAVRLVATPPAPYLPFEMMDSHLAGDRTIDITLSTELPTLIVWSGGAMEEGRSDTTGDVGFVFQLSAPVSHPVSVDYHTLPGTATPGEDYTPISGTLEFAPGDTFKSVYVGTFGDDAVEPDEDFAMVADNVSGAMLTSAPSSFILRNDDVPLPALALQAPDPIAEGASGVNNAISVAARLSSPAGKNGATVAWHTEDGTATGGQDYAHASGNIAFAVGETTASAVVETYGDALYEGDETFYVVFDTATGATSDVQRIPVTLLNDDVPLPALVVQAPDPFAEGGPGTHHQVAVVASLSAPAGAQGATVSWHTEDGTATGYEDYAPASGSLSFAPGGTTGSIVLDAFGDDHFEGDETFYVVFDQPTGATSDVQRVPVMLLNDDVSPPMPPPEPRRPGPKCTADGGHPPAGTGFRPCR